MDLQQDRSGMGEALELEFLHKILIAGYILYRVEEFKRFLLKELSERLRAEGFAFTEPEGEATVIFDLAARRDNEGFVIKILYNVDTIREDNARELIHICRILSAAAIVIGKRASNGDLENDIVYFRHNIPIMTYETFISYLDGEHPFVYSAHGGFYVSIEGNTLRMLREEKRYSIGYVSNAVGISRRSISLYEAGSAATYDVYSRLQRLFRKNIRKTIDLMDCIGPLETANTNEDLLDAFSRLVSKTMLDIGFDMFTFRRTPFDAVATDRVEDQIIMGLTDELRTYVKGRSIADLSRVFEKYSMVVSRSKTDKSSIGGCPVVNYKDILSVPGKDELVDLIKKKMNVK